MLIQSIGRNIGKWLLGAGIAVAVACEEKSESPAAPVIESVSAEADIRSATISFHVSGGLKGVRESGVRFGLDELDVAHDKDDRETRVQGGEDPSRHDYIIIELQNLEPATRYYYQVFIGNGRSRVESDIFTFTTRPAGVEPPVPTPEWLEMDNTALLEALVARYDRNLDGGLDAGEVESLTEIDVTDLGLTDLSGIELFPNLEKLLCSGNLLPELDISACPVLNYLDCSPMQDENRQTVLKTIWVRLDQPIDFIEKPEKTVIRIKY